MAKENAFPPASTLTADDLIRIFNDPDGELRHYKFQMGRRQIDVKLEDVFHMSVPYEEIKAQVDGMRKEFYENLDPDEHKRPAFLHVGSTSIKGMPGTLNPDVMVMEERFPPSPSTVKAIIATGFRFESVAPHGDKDYWFMKKLTADHIGPERTAALHLVEEADPAGKVIRRITELCNNDPAAFDEYKAAKLAARGGSFIEYKLGKKKGLIQRVMQEEGQSVS